MIEQIQMLRRGRRILADTTYNSEKAKFEAAYANASEDLKRLVDAYMAYSRNQSSADPTRNLNAKERDAEGYANATAMLNGQSTFAPSPSLPRNGFFRSTADNQAFADNNASEFMAYNLNNTKSSKTDSEESDKHTGNYVYQWNKGLSWGTDEDTLADRIKALISTVKLNLQAASEAEAAGKNIRGINTEDLHMVINNFGLLDSIAALADTDPKKAYGQLTRIAPKLGLTDIDEYKNYFGDLLPLQTAAEKNLAALKSQGYTEYDLSGNPYWKNWMEGHDYKVVRSSDGTLYLYNKDYSAPVTEEPGFINDDWAAGTAGGYKQALAVGSNGKIWFGDSSQLNSSHWAYNVVENLRKGIFGQRDQLVTHSVFKPGQSAGDMTLDRLSKLSRFNGRQFAYLDVSKLFGGDERVIAVNPNGADFRRDVYGNYKFDNNTQFYYIGADGGLKFSNWATMKNKFKREGFDEETPLADITNQDNFSLIEEASLNLDGKFTADGDVIGQGFGDYVSDKFNSLLGGLGWGTAAGAAGAGAIGSIVGTNIWNPVGWIAAGAAALTTIGSIIGYDMQANIGEKPELFINAVVKAILKPNDYGAFESIAKGSSEESNAAILQRLYNDDKAGFLAFLWNLGKEKGMTSALKSVIANAYNRAVNYDGSRTNTDQVSSNKEGGILYAKEGKVVDAIGNSVGSDDYNTANQKYLELREKAKNKASDDYDKLESDAKENGYDKIDTYLKNNEEVFSKNFSASDFIRIGSIAADVTSIVASFTGAGMPVAEGAGLVSFGADTVADLLDPSVKTGEFWRNMGVNAGMAAISFVPGANTGKVMSKIVKYAPKVLAVVGAAGIALDPSVHKTFSKLNDSNAKLTREDWKNIAHVFTAAATLSRGGRRAYERHMAKKDLFKGAEKSSIFKIGDKEIVIPKDKVESVGKEFDKAQKAASKGETDKATDILAKALGDTEENQNEIKQLLQNEDMVSENGLFKRFASIRNFNSKGSINGEIETRLSYDKNQAVNLINEAADGKNKNYWRLRELINITGDESGVPGRSTYAFNKKGLLEDANAAIAGLTPAQSVRSKIAGALPAHVTNSNPMNETITGNEEILARGITSKEDIGNYISAVEYELAKPNRWFNGRQIKPNTEVGLQMIRYYNNIEHELRNAVLLPELTATLKRQIYAEINQVSALKRSILNPAKDWHTLFTLN